MEYFKAEPMYHVNSPINISVCISKTQRIFLEYSNTITTLNKINNVPYLIAYIQVIPINKNRFCLVSSFKLGSGQVIFTTFGSYAPFNILIVHQSRTVFIFIFCLSGYFYMQYFSLRNCTRCPVNVPHSVFN